MRKYLMYLAIVIALPVICLMTVPKMMVEATNNLCKKSLSLNIKTFLMNIVNKFQIANFMLVGGIGYLVNMGIYYPLTMLFKNEVTFLGQQFYLPPFVVSSLIAILCNYWLNKKFTFKGQQEKQFGFGRYLLMALTTLILDMGLLFVVVEYGGLQPILGAALAILIVFVVRFIIAKYWIWGERTHRTKEQEVDRLELH